MANLIQQIHFHVYTANLTALDKSWNTLLFNPIHRCIPFSRLYMPCSGEGFIESGEKKYLLKKGSIFLVAPYARVLVNCPDKMVKYWCHFNASVAEIGNDIFSMLPEVTELKLTGRQFEFNVNLFEGMISATKDKKDIPALDALRVNAAITLLADPFLKLIPQKEIHSIDIDRIIKLIHYMHSNLASVITVETLAKVVNLHPNYLSTIFLHYMGCPPIAYLNNLKLTFAMKELQNGKMRIGEIAERIGIPNPSAFSQFFRHRTGLSPRQWQKKNPWSI